jgi:hypothetical protein
MGRDVAQMVAYVLCQCEALSSKPSPTKKKYVGWAGYGAAYL